MPKRPLTSSSHRSGPTLLLLLLAFSCDSSSGGLGGSDAGSGTGGQGSASAGSGGGTGGDGATGGSSPGGGGTNGTGGPAVVTCASQSVGRTGAIANPEDFSLTPGTHAGDQHTLVMRRADMVRQQVIYTTAGPADHQHEVVFTTEQLAQLIAGQAVVATTSGPPLNAATGHGHTVAVTPCP